MSDVDLDEYSASGQASYIQQADIIESQPFLMPGWVTEEESSSLNTGANGKIGRVRGYATKSNGVGVSPMMHAVDWTAAGPTNPRIDVFQKQLFADTDWTEVSTSGETDASLSGTEPTGGCWFEDGSNSVLYFFTNYSNNLRVGSFNTGTGVVNLNLYAIGWTGAGYVLGFIQHTDGETYVFTDNAIGLPANTGATGALATFPNFLEPVDAISYGNKILVACNNQEGQTAKLFIKDPYSNSFTYTFDDVYDIPVFRVCCIRKVAGRVIIITADYDYKIWQWNGGDDLTLLKTLKVGGYNATFTIDPRAVDVKDGILYFGTSCNVTNFNNGIYAFGFNNDGSTFLHNAFPSISSAQGAAIVADTSSQNFKAIKWYDDGGSASVKIGNTLSRQVGLFATAWDVTTNAYRNMEYVINSSRTADLDWRSVWIRPFPGLRTQIVKASLYHEPIASATIAMYQATDIVDQITWDSTNLRLTASSTSSSFTQVGNNATLRGTTTGTNTAFTSGRKHKIRITMSAGAKLEKVKLRVRTTEQE